MKLITLRNRNACSDENKKAPYRGLYVLYGGGSGIRTLDGRETMPVFKTGAFNRSANPPRGGILLGMACRDNSENEIYQVIAI